MLKQPVQIHGRSIAEMGRNAQAIDAEGSWPLAGFGLLCERLGRFGLRLGGTGFVIGKANLSVRPRFAKMGVFGKALSL